MTTHITTNIHTVFILVGPSGCGKSYFSKNHLIPKLQGLEGKNTIVEKIAKKAGFEKIRKKSKPARNVAYISSDEIRRELLGYDYHKYDDEMIFASEEAFKVLNKKLDSVTSFPINAEFVVIDTTGLSKSFRDTIIKITERNHYRVEAIVFDYKNKEDYQKYLEGYDMSIVYRQLKRFNRETQKELSRKDFHHIHKIKSKDFSSVKFEIKDLNQYKETFLPDGKEYEYPIISDIHGCFPEFKELLVKNDFVIVDNEFFAETDIIIDKKAKKRKIILVGDLIDKGKYIKETIEFIYKNRNRFLIVLGNHENFVYKYLKGKLKKDILPQEFLKEQFGTIFILQENISLRNKFFELVESSKPLYRSKYFIVTHAPCERKYLGKLDRVSVKSQRNITCPRPEDFKDKDEYIKEYENTLSFLKKEAQPNQPFHIFGHIAFSKTLRLKNKIGIDTNCVKGGKLTSVVINGRFSPYFIQVSNKEIVKLPEHEKLELFSKKEKNINYGDLSEKEKFRIKKLTENKVNFISGTMCPADKDIDQGILESIENALSYYKKRNVRKVILQPKYMGSRCNVYLFKEIEKCYATSRNGYLINKNIDLTPIYENLLRRHKADMEKEGILLKVIDAELMPWYALGKGLIESQYKVVEKALESEICFLRDTGFEKALDAIEVKMNQTDFLKDHGSYSNKKSQTQITKKFFRILSRIPLYSPRSLNKQELVDKYSHTVYSTFKNYLSFSKSHIPLKEQEKMHEVYKEQLKIFGSEENLNIKPFAILKDVYEDGSEVNYFDATNEEVFTHVSDDAYLVIDLEDEKSLEKAESFYHQLTVKEKMEGVVIKPNDAVYIEGLAPYRKVRNKEYLTIIYGYDYLSKHKYEKLLKQKRIDKKLKLSIREFELGKKMLEIPYSEIHSENNTYTNLVIQMIAEEKKEVGLDPRL